ncbi:MAG: hypothetical protein JWO73_510 [Candidatus Taylorbacteria bacterium]|nr:hypothetical protein [Candidatus Taylorbacteria bacterium]
MSKAKTVQIIRAEIKRLNEDIDMKIIRGLSYRNEARRHKSLISQLARLTMKGELQRYEVRSEVKQVIQSFQMGQMKWYQRPFNFSSAGSFASAFLL